jgi:rRNA maturation RNase YbeY
MYVDFINETDVCIEENVFSEIFGWFVEDNLLRPTDTCCVKLSNNSDVQLYNEKYRGSNECTDVLSFPCDFVEIPFVGDIIINIDEAYKQKGDNSLDATIFMLFIHGLLHLSGMEHTSHQQKKHMDSYEIKYADKYRVTFNC